MNNIELKAHYLNDKALDLVKKLQISNEYVLQQLDTYFNINKDRLKLREINNERAELIWYSRPDELEAKNSNYEIYESNNSNNLKKVLTSSLGVKVVVNKLRKAYIYNDCRIHIDKVENLGEFLEFEVVMIPERTDEQAKELMKFLKNHFKINNDDLINVSYSDMIIEKNSNIFV